MQSAEQTGTLSGDEGCDKAAQGERIKRKSDMDETVIRVADVSKVYKLYKKPSERLFDALGLARRGRFK